MSKMAELEYEQRMAADQSEDTLGCLPNTHQVLNAVLDFMEDGGKLFVELDTALTERHTFNDWWNYGEVSPGDNPYTHETAAYWAWEGWQAAIRARGQE